MLNKSLAAIAALSLAATPAVAAPSASASAAGSASALSVQPTLSDGAGVANPFTAPGATVGIALFTTIVVLGILLGTGTLFDDDSVSA